MVNQQQMHEYDDDDDARSQISGHSSASTRSSASASSSRSKRDPFVFIQFVSAEAAQYFWTTIKEQLRDQFNQGNFRGGPFKTITRGSRCRKAERQGGFNDLLFGGPDRRYRELQPHLIFKREINWATLSIGPETESQAVRRVYK